MSDGPFDAFEGENRRVDARAVDTSFRAADHLPGALDRPGARAEYVSPDRDVWLRLVNGDERVDAVPYQGVKLHVAAKGGEEAATTEAVARGLASHEATTGGLPSHKFVESGGRYAMLNNPAGDGAPQSGKFVAVYPGFDDETADLLAAEYGEASTESHEQALVDLLKGQVSEPVAQNAARMAEPNREEAQAVAESLAESLAEHPGVTTDDVPTVSHGTERGEFEERVGESHVHARYGRNVGVVADPWRGVAHEPYTDPEEFSFDPTLPAADRVRAETAARDTGVDR